MSALRGLVLVDKPAGITSHDVVAVVRRAARSKRVGHAGTLDPFATGLLVLAVGAYTRAIPYLDGEPKVYDAVIRFGAETDTDDGTGETVREAPLPADDAVDAAIAALTGTLAQVPPQYSAKHVDGTRAYALARRGTAVDMPPVTVVVHRWEAHARDGADLHARIVCAGGTYVRALARDLGRLAGSAAHCAALRRIASGQAHVDAAIPLERMEPGAIADGRVALLSPTGFLADATVVELDEQGLRDVQHGRAVMSGGETPVGGVAGLVREGELVAVAAGTGAARWQPKVVFA